MPIFSAPAANGVSLSDALREAAAYAPIDRVQLLTYEFVHPAFTSRALVVINHEDITATTEEPATVTFTAIGGLRSEGPEESDQAGSPMLKLTLDGVSQMVITNFDLALTSMDPVQIIERIYMSDDLTGPALLPPAKAYVRSGKITETRVEVEVGFGDPANQPFPRRNYTRETHPGLVP